jgi:Sec-independent protein translocase protein TatA
MSLIDLLVEIRKRRTVRELRRLMAALEQAVKEDNENQQNENRTTDRNPHAARHHTTA